MDSQQILKQIEALAQDSYEISKMKWNEEKNRAMSIQDILTVEQIQSKLSRFDIDIQNEENLYIRAVPTIEHEIIFIDDSTPIASEFLKQQNIIPACVVQTSTDSNDVPRLHCWYKMPRKLDVATRKAVERVIIEKLHAEFPNSDPKKMPGDFGSNDGMHRGRLAGTWNFGLGKERDEAVTLIEATSHVLSQDVADALLGEARQYISDTPKIQKEDCNLSEIIEHKYDNEKIVRYFLENVMTRMNSNYEHYQQDIFAAAKLFHAKFSALDIKKVLFEHDPNPISERKPGREAHFLENIMRYVKNEKLLPDDETPPQDKEGGEVFMPFSSSSCPGASAPAAASGKNGTSPSPKNTENNQQSQQHTNTNTAAKKPIFQRPRLGVRPRPKAPTLSTHSPKP